MIEDLIQTLHSLGIKIERKKTLHSLGIKIERKKIQKVPIKMIDSSKVFTHFQNVYKYYPPNNFDLNIY
jgi:5-enolpyruvylshikimate-3-phosphate synthase